MQNLQRPANEKWNSGKCWYLKSGVPMVLVVAFVFENKESALNPPKQVHLYSKFESYLPLHNAIAAFSITRVHPKRDAFGLCCQNETILPRVPWRCYMPQHLIVQGVNYRLNKIEIPAWDCSLNYCSEQSRFPIPPHQRPAFQFVLKCALEVAANPFHSLQSPSRF